jgi:hypothetical protein
MSATNGISGMTARRRPDVWDDDWTWRDRGRWAWQNLVPVAAISLAAWAVFGVGQALERQTREADERRNQTCTLFETDHLQDVQSLKRTYERLPEALDFYMEAAPERLQPFLRATIAGDLERLEREAKADSAPPYCDEPGFGLPEPDPVIPKRPPGLFK